MHLTQPPALHPGSTRLSATGLVTTPLGYARDEIEPGTPLSVASTDSAGALSRAVDRCDEVIFAFDGKLGDTVLAFGALAAIMDYLHLTRPDRLPAMRTRGTHHGLVNQVTAPDDIDVHGDAATSASARSVLVGDRAGLSAARDEVGHALAVIECNPEQPPCWSSGPFAYPFLPARYFLDLEQRLGLRLSDHDQFMPTLTTRVGHPPDAQAFTVGVITATSWPVRKDYRADRFLAALRPLAGELAQPIHILIVPGAADISPLIVDMAPPELTIDVLPNAHYSLAARHLAACDLVIGNDTGLTHLAAATRQPDGTGPHVVGLYARHSHTKWRTGLPWHHALATAFSEAMHRDDLCPVRDRIDDRQYGPAADIAAIPTDTLTQAARTVLSLEQEASR
jgi:hypothetical protein